MFEDAEWEAIRREQGWNDYSCIRLMEVFIKKIGYEGEFLDYLRDLAEFENDEGRFMSTEEE
jgi:hypothetical protein